MTNTKGKIAYNAYCAQTNWKSLVSGQDLPKWEALKSEIRIAWECAAQAVCQSIVDKILSEESKRLRTIV